MGIGPHDHLLLHLFGELVQEAWGHLGYLVGSSQRGEPWRDIDVRVMVSDEEFERWFGAQWQEGKRHNNPLWRAHMLAWSKLGQQMTGLPVDFQVERLSEANAKHAGEPRNPVGLWRTSPGPPDPESPDDWHRRLSQPMDAALRNRP